MKYYFIIKKYYSIILNSKKVLLYKNIFIDKIKGKIIYSLDKNLFYDKYLKISRTKII